MTFKKLATYILGGIILLAVIYFVYVVNISIIKPNNQIRQEINRANSTTTVTTQDSNSRELQILRQVAISIQNRDYVVFSTLVDVESFTEPSTTTESTSQEQLLNYFTQNSDITNHPDLEFLSTAISLNPTASTTGGITIITFEKSSAIVYLDQFEDTITIQGIDLDS